MIIHVDQHGIVSESPAAIVEMLSREMARPISPDVAALAMMVASETDWKHPETAPLRAHIALNDLADLHRRHPDWSWTSSIEGLITYSSLPLHRGHFGRQENGRRYASDKPATFASVAVAEESVAARARGEDPTGGALKFIDKRSMLVQHGTRPFEEVAAQWASEGLRPFQLAGYPSDLYVFRRIA